MATDVDVQYFSHLNGLVLGNNWGDMIRLLDACLINGVELPSVTSASIDEQGDVHLTLFAPHKAMLLQVVELTGFEPVSLNQKYRIKGIPSDSQIILKPQSALTETIITKKGVCKLASLGYDIVFRDVNDVKRVYRAKNPTAQHPYIRVDESLASPDGSSGVYNSTYSKFAMVGLLEHMDHIDDFENPNVLQLPFDPSNWKISGTGGSCARGLARWYWARNADTANFVGADSDQPQNGTGAFSVFGDVDAFYIISAFRANAVAPKVIMGCGLFNPSIKSFVKEWFLMAQLSGHSASLRYKAGDLSGGSPLVYNQTGSSFLTTNLNELTPLSNSAQGLPIVPDYLTGYSGLFNANNVSALEVPFKDTGGYLRGTLKHLLYSGKQLGNIGLTTPKITESSMYIADTVYTNDIYNIGGIYAYLGELE